MPEPRWLGVAAPGLPRDLTAFDQISTAIGHTPKMITWYEHFWWNNDFSTKIQPYLDAIRDKGATPQMTWEPWGMSNSANDPAYSCLQIASGAFDAYITQMANGIKAWSYPLRIRLAHEMNNRGYPWVAGLNGNTPDDYIRMWLHIRKIFSDVGATNVRWVWCPQNVFPGTVPLSALFPGDVAIDEAGVDGYNPTPWGSPWTSFEIVFRRTISELTLLTSRPISIGETGCPEVGGDKSAWIREMWATLAKPEWRQVRGVTWFNFNKEADWRIDSSPTSLAAFRDGINGYLSS